MNRKRRKENGKIVTTKREPVPITKARMIKGIIYFAKELTKNIIALLIGVGKVEIGFKKIFCKVTADKRYIYVRLAVPEEESNAVMLKNHIIAIREKGFKKFFYMKYKSTYDACITNPDPNCFTMIIDTQSQKLNVAISKSLV